ncbi:S-layer homology domain-containing protein [Paenibacillus brevis]|uniref:S-layer homology domain-containing protein n=1 Tax=Paenibacillus brevis TaxID=2841508 RepID=A0ABS6FL75_9BACL|nr:S-layer homology domain-containing protein [Paenibacillus brevis]MBU5670904.1 S-layer homology domain-containing protein [Paenibacillus brevis]
MKKTFTKLTSMVMLMCLVVTSMGPFQSAHASQALKVTEGQVQGEYALDLSKVGNVDWLHLKGDNQQNVIQIKKAGGSSVTFDVYGDTGTEGKIDRGGDGNYLSYSWTDGMTGYEQGDKDTGFGIFFPSLSRNPGDFNNVGWNFTVAPQPQESTVVFAIGLWQADADIHIYGDDVLFDTRKIGAGGTSQIYKYQISIPANVSLKVEGRMTKARIRDGNMTFSGLALSSADVVDKIALHNEYRNVKDMTQGLFSEASWQSFVTAREEAKVILDQLDATQQEVDNALQTLIAAQAALVKRDTNIMIDFMGSGSKEFTFGAKGDQQDRYQTFTAKENFEMEFVQVVVNKANEPVSDMLVKLYATDSQGLPTGAALTETSMAQNKVVSGAITTIPLQYQLVQNTRYAVVLSQQILGSGEYRWQVMNKSFESQNEFFGKTVTGTFKSEAGLGTGMLRVVEKSNVDRSNLLSLMNEVEQYNNKLFNRVSWSQVEVALTQAEDVMNDMDVKQDTLNLAFNQLGSAISNLVLNVGLDEVAEQIISIRDAVVTGYTANSVAALNTAIQEAMALAAGASEQERIMAYSKVLNSLESLRGEGKYQYEVHPNMTAAFGYEGDKNASLAFLDGSYQIGGYRHYQHGPVAPKQMVTFGVTDTSDIKWYNAEGYLPAFINEFTKHEMENKMESFANKHTVEGKGYVINYSRMTVTNHSRETRLLPVVSSNLIPINEAANQVYTIAPGETVTRDYAIESDKYEYFDEGKTVFTSLTREQVAAQGNFDDNYNDMKLYWDNRLSFIVDLDLPNKELVNAYKAGYIYTLIIKDDTYLHVGENGYARLFSHDTIGILVQLIESGDFAYAEDYLNSIPLTGGINIETGEVDPDQYWDANWKLPWAYAVYLSKTGDASIFDKMMTGNDGLQGTVFDKRIKIGARSIESDRMGDSGIMKKTYAIDDEGFWTIDNYSALMGLVSYEYITRELYRIKGDAGYLAEADWAEAQHADLLAKFTEKLQKTITDNGLNYIPASVVESNDKNRMRDSRDGNWASMYLFGRWLWDGYRYGADQPEDNINLTMMDDTYTYGIDRRTRENTTDSPYNFGGYPHGFYSSAYNAGYGSSALRGEEYRDMGIKAYEFMIEKSMSGPFSWWEGIAYPNASSPWVATNEQLGLQNTPGGGGSAQHMWGQAVNSKVLIDSLIAERIYDQNQKYEIIIGRGIPKEWVQNAALNNNVVADVQNYPAFQGGRVGYKIEKQANKLVVTLTSHLEQAKVGKDNASFSIQLPSMVNNILKVSDGVVDQGKGIVTVPLNTDSVTIVLADLPAPTDIELDKEALEIGFAAGDSETLVTRNVNLPTVGVHGSVITWSSSEPGIISETGIVKRPSTTTQVTLTATLEKDGVQVQKAFVLTVPMVSVSQPVWPAGSQLMASRITQNSVVLNWTPAESQTDLIYYKITWGTQSMLVNGNRLSVELNGLHADTTYTFRVEAEDKDGLWSNDGPVVTVKTKADGNSGNPGNSGSGNSSNNGNNGNGNNSNGNSNSGNNGSNNNGNIGTTTKPKFTDIANHWASEAIASAVELGMIKGYEDGTLRPNGAVTRSELMVMLGRMLGLQQEDAALSFKDAADIPAWANPYIVSVVKSGFANGYEDGTFRPGGKITRMELMAIVARALNLKAETNISLSFTDSNQVPSWGAAYVAALYEVGLIEGKDNNRLAPNDQVTRAEAVTLLLRMDNYQAGN